MNDDAKQLLAAYEPKEEKKSLKADMQLCQVRYSPCGKFLVAGCFDGTVRRWDLSKDDRPEMNPVKGHGGWVQAVAFHPTDGRAFSVDSWGRLSAWNYAEETPQLLWTVEAAHNGWIHALAIDAEGNRLATCGMDRAVRIWSAADGVKQKDLPGHADDIYSVAFHPQGKSLVSGDLQGVVKHWDLETGQATRSFDCGKLHMADRLQDFGGVRFLAFDKDGTSLACTGFQPKNGGNVQGVPTIMIFGWEDGALKHTLSYGAAGDGYVYEAHWHPRGFVMAVSSGNPGAGKFVFFKPGDDQPFFQSAKMANCHSLGVHPDGRQLAVVATNGGSNGNGRSLKDGKYPANFSPVHIWEIPAAS